MSSTAKHAQHFTSDLIVSRYLRSTSNLTTVYDGEVAVPISGFTDSDVSGLRSGGEFVRMVLMISDSLAELHSKGIIHTNLHDDAVCFTGKRVEGGRGRGSGGGSGHGGSSSTAYRRCIISNFKRSMLASPNADAPIREASPSGHSFVFLDPSLGCLNVVNERTDVFALGLHMLHFLERMIGSNQCDRMKRMFESTPVPVDEWYRNVYLRNALYGHDMVHVFDVLRQDCVVAENTSVDPATMPCPIPPYPSTWNFERWMRETNTPVWRRIEVCMGALKSLWSVSLRNKISAVVLRCLHPLCSHRPRAAEVSDMLREMHRFSTEFRAVSLFPEHTVLFKVPNLSEWPEQLPSQISARCFAVCRTLGSTLCSMELDTLRSLEFAALSTLLIQWTRCWEMDREHGTTSSVSEMVHLAWLLYTKRLHEMTDEDTLKRFLSSPRLDHAAIIKAQQLFLYLISKPSLAQRAQRLDTKAQDAGTE